VLALFGPTAVGKTALALELADQLRRRGYSPVAVSADALQVYRGIELLTGVASADEQRRLEHRLVSFVPIDEPFSVGRYAELAHEEIDDLLAAGRTPIVVGGTGLYLRAALAELDLAPPPPPEIRAHWTRQLELVGVNALHDELARRAPGVAARIDRNDRTRVLRELELNELGATATRDGPSQLWTSATRHPTLLAGVTMQRETLYRQIDARVDGMVAAGAAEQVRAAAAAGASQTASAALGFSELLAGDIDAMKLRTRQFARRQLTWMRKLAGAQLVDVTGRTPQDVAEELLTNWPPAPPAGAGPAPEIGGAV
jgi:tRNA dimethylallyltransferase